MQSEAQLNQAVGRLPSGRFVITAAHGDARAGVVVKSVQACADEPTLISVAVRKGHAIEPLIRDSHVFAICWIEEDDLLTQRIFAVDAPVELDAQDQHDPFAAIAVETLATGAPVLTRARLVLDCSVVRHFDLEADHELYIGQVVAARTEPIHGCNGAADPAPPTGSTTPNASH